MTTLNVSSACSELSTAEGVEPRLSLLWWRREPTDLHDWKWEDLLSEHDDLLEPLSQDLLIILLLVFFSPVGVLMEH